MKKIIIKNNLEYETFIGGNIPEGKYDYILHYEGNPLFGITVENRFTPDGKIGIGWFSQRGSLEDFRNFQELVNFAEEFIRENNLF